MLSVLFIPKGRLEQEENEYRITRYFPTFFPLGWYYIIWVADEDISLEGEAPIGIYKK